MLVEFTWERTIENKNPRCFGLVRVRHAECE